MKRGNLLHDDPAECCNPVLSLVRVSGNSAWYPKSYRNSMRSGKPRASGKHLTRSRVKHRNDRRAGPGGDQSNPRLSGPQVNTVSARPFRKDRDDLSSFQQGDCPLEGLQVGSIPIDRKSAELTNQPTK